MSSESTYKSKTGRSPKPQNTDKPQQSSETNTEKPSTAYKSKTGRSKPAENTNSSNTGRTFREKEKVVTTYKQRPYEKKKKENDKREFSNKDRRSEGTKDKRSFDKPVYKKQSTDKEFSNKDRRSEGVKEKRNSDKPVYKKQYTDKKDSAKGYKTAGKRQRIVKKQAEELSDNVRLNKFIANSGICSRREADTFITAGLVTVNGEVVTTLGTKVKYDDDIRCNGQRLSGEQKVYLLLNKPKDCITTTDDPHAKKTVMDIIEGACSERIYPIGRLDRNTTGLLLFTNDGDLAKVLTHPSYEKKKVYHVGLDKKINVQQMQQLLDGIELEDGFMKFDEIEYVEMNDKTQIGVEIHSGKNRVVRRMFEALGFDVIKLDRVYYAGLTKKNLPRGKWRFLTPQEINILKKGSYE